MRLIVCGGGTGGHVYPALAILRAVQELQPATEVLYVGTAGGLEAGIVGGEGLPFEAVPSGGIVGKGPLAAVGAGLAAARGVLAAVRILRRFRADVVLGTGGYAAGPVALAARLCGVPLVLHEQNAFPGVTNRVASRWAYAVAVPFAEARSHFPRGARVVVTGNPVRRSILETTAEEGRRVLGVPPRGSVLYVVGGSRGAQVLNRAFLEALPGLLGVGGLSIVFSTGRRYYDEVRAGLASRGLAAGPTGSGGVLVVVPYVERADAALAAADLIVTRGGGTTLAEVTARGVPAVIVPSPNVTHNHQEFNARVLARAGAATVLLERELDGPALERVLKELLGSPETLRAMREASRRLGRPEAARDIARLVLRAAGCRARRGQAYVTSPDGPA
ncbi:MAG: undecaprenyldiphospho-muramoylpentapeptide beta-N-acetylglucosaminyltransferase [Firmicutes bacterium]|nr:undecaprenyldiphospho-muramoylpentapeptide beta-N-acetylglucosaminyltransferase [Bacillota bacterium]